LITVRSLPRRDRRCRYFQQCCHQ